MKPLTLCLLILFTLAAKAAAPVDSVIGTLAPRCTEAHLAAKVQADVWTLLWDYADSANFCAATFRHPDSRHRHTAPGSKCQIELWRSSNGRRHTIGIAQTAAEEPYSAVRLVSDSYGARLYAGSPSLTAVDIPLPPLSDGDVRIALHSPGKIEYAALRGTAPAAIPVAECNLDSVLGAAAGPWAGLWEYLDRDIDTGRATFSGMRTAAIIPSADGTYTLLYLEGDNHGDQPMQKKAILRPTIFPGTCDMDWRAADGTILSDGNWAQLSLENSIITLYFPLYKSQIRLRRHK